MRINNNVQALNAYRNLSNNQQAISTHLQRLSSGLRINSASDDAAGLAISEKMRSQIRGLAAAERNTLDGISLIQTAEGALDSVHQMLQRMRELAVQAANGTYAEIDREAIQEEVNQLLSEINRIGNTTEFNTRNLLDGSMGEDGEILILQIGANEGQAMGINIEDSRARALGLTLPADNDGDADGSFYNSMATVTNVLSDEVEYERALDFTNFENAANAITAIDNAINKISTERSKLGAIQNRLEYTATNLQVFTENITASESRIRDADMALEMSSLTKNNIITQAATAMLAQANQLPQGVLQLLQ
ncbi:flagellin [Heliorestis convoluta]|uniref:Flagellin n=1 Tax=Heliorestis convoluta TaxID=356322 RepID=A0A5Q2MXM7_9FIRM|nr:flagellin [Heliorestis convoluta]QGG47514.1 flagellin domain protein [Heliorestis convoluta]